MKTILGIDQGIANIGYSVLKETENGQIIIIESGTKKTSSKDSMEERLGVIYDFFNNVIDKYPEISEIGMEDFFYGGLNYCRSVSIVTTNQVSGILLLLARNRGISARKIAPTQVKKTITGKGNANKEMVMDSVKSIFNQHIFKTDHECDSIAIGYTLLKASNS